MPESCPYCDHDVEIDHDDGYGYEEDQIYEQECRHCGKTFTYTTSISFYYDLHQADCLNGAEHRFTKHTMYPRGTAFDYWECRDCGKRQSNPPQA